MTLLPAITSPELPDPGLDEIGFLHSALCTMSLPVRRPADEYAPILRQDGRYSMLIQPRAFPDGQGGFTKVGVPFGAKARLVLIHIMTEAVRSNSPDIWLGRSLSHWMRRLGYQSFSGGPSGTMTLFKEQVKRLARCDWTIRRQLEDGEGAQLSDVRLSDDLILWSDGQGGEFVETLALNQRFFDHLRDHAVPLSERALYQLRDNPTALDLYVWLVYRLPRLQRPAVLSWAQVASHFGNDYRNLRQFRHEMRKLLPKVLEAYPGARVDMDGSLVRLLPSQPAVARSRTGWTAALAKVLDNMPDKVSDKPPGGGRGVRASSEAPGARGASSTCALMPKFAKALGAHLETKTVNAWLSDARFEDRPDGLTLVCGSAFKADYVRAHFHTVIALAASQLGWEQIAIAPGK
jgi:hypothetical protein